MSVHTFEQQLQELLRQADDPYLRLVTGLSQALAILQDGQRRATDEAVAHLLNVIQPSSAVRRPVPSVDPRPVDYDGAGYQH